MLHWEERGTVVVNCWDASPGNCQATHMDPGILLRIDLQSVHSISTLNNIFSRVCVDVDRYLVFIPVRQWKQGKVSGNKNSFMIRSTHTSDSEFLKGQL